MNRIALVIMLMLTLRNYADDLVITSISGYGEVTWNHPTNGVKQYRIEWASTPEPDKWTDIESGICGITPTGNTMTAEVPMLYRIRAIATNLADMVYVPPGEFTMGDVFQEDDIDERPVHAIFIDGFYIDRFEVSKAGWDDVYNWAVTNGYSFANAGSGKADNHPVHTVNWYDCIKWANAKSEREQLTPCYYTDATTTTVYRTGELDVSNNWVRWDAEGYRLPTEAEWEKAARGGASGYRFAWADNTISFSRANYYSWWNGGIPAEGYDLAYTNGYHPKFNDGVSPYTSPVEEFGCNGYGLYGLAGNVYEWCWDWYDSGYYNLSAGTNPHGPGPQCGGAPGDYSRVSRGGYYASGASFCRVSFRGFDVAGFAWSWRGFRLVRAGP